jgi:phosphopantothenate-cysteine ligase
MIPCVTEMPFSCAVQMVIGNILQTRKQRVMLVMPDTSNEIQLSSEEMEAGIEIESKIVANLAERHKLFMKGASYNS